MNQTVKTNGRAAEDLVCLSHLRWGFVYQRPQHLLSRFARHRRVFFFEEPIFKDGEPRLDSRRCEESGVLVVTPVIPSGLGSDAERALLRMLLDRLFKEERIEEYFLWYYTPMALEFSRKLTPRCVVFDCMDELSAFAGAPKEMKDRETELMHLADLMFTGGQSLYEAKQGKHPKLHLFASSVDVAHFAQAREIRTDPADQAQIPRLRIGYCGVIDERMNLALLKQVADLRPDWHFVMVGPVVKIDPAELPQMKNIHFLGGKTYKELPAYLAGWDVAMLPFAHNDSTRFISPTKTPEYLAAGKPVVSTSITDVVRPYGIDKLVRIADDAESWVTAIEACMKEEAQSSEWRRRVDAMLSTNSWDLTWSAMNRLIEAQLKLTQIPGSPLNPVKTSMPAASTQ